ncbi:MAG: hypothetical protein COZ75_00280 [Flavobacteriaceae bacterium CG_4_8_14_3_um_filter_34_10]|nr:hypothetical protein [Flavobacteriia bacterium]PIQ18241.1 MAG: hypothetical protein COW66_07540 [Flavobacteriaceae bacterium CG18_big_fil_WC_8_21_14_2_50_34_36]PIV50197.1 MAG: hypothetical protein COS19_04810 [Flavobacteriaceae bacterium CG02_land_8_20_14_3_00_34_13]PIX10686.1 MAG: hypothetical protein COZ75_00280 [Flavobacteriaceae bacterium CG_4_8_14_3_um_filter_34_10]PIZ09049.1 MAG: hypothetical protein COY56_00665 [Flavobacteriaceae bacterium CG_4_10_14_0_8_um_filter_34_31]PJC08287.1 MA
MKKTVLVFFSFFLIFSCVENKKEENQPIKKIVNDNKKYPSSLVKIFNAHGGLSTWQKMKTLSYEIETTLGTEVHTTDLNLRQAVIASNAFKLGFDGVGVWLEDKEGVYSGNATFYYNQMFYFYTMPFIIADEGAFYTERKDAVIERKTYGVLHIGFERNVGESPEDEYIIYYNKETYQMEWLGYTVTYFDGNKNTNWQYIKYDTWRNIEGLLLPEKLVWYEQNNRVFTPSQTLIFTNVKISETALIKSFFQAPEGSEFIEK